MCESPARTLTEQALPAVLWNPDHMVASWTTLRDLAADEHAFLVFPHDPDFRDWLLLAPEHHYV